MDELLVDFLSESAEHLAAIRASWPRSALDVPAAGVVDELFIRIRALVATEGLLELPRLQRLASAAGALNNRLRGAGPDPAAVDLASALIEKLHVILIGAAPARREPAGDDNELIARVERETVAPTPDRRPYLIVFALNETFALPIAYARSGLRIGTVTPAAFGQPHLLGFADLGGAAVAVVCLARRLEPSARPSESGIAVLIASHGQTFALAVQDFGDVVQAGEADITPARAALSSRALRMGTLTAPILDPELVFDPTNGGASHGPSTVNQETENEAGARCR